MHSIGAFLPIYGFGAGGQNMGGVGSAPWRPGMIGNGVI
jgi:hypothetical protein